MIAADQATILDKAERQLGRAMATTVLKAGDISVRGTPQHDVAVKKLKGLGLAVEPGRPHRRVPELTQQGLLRHEHGRHCLLQVQG